MHLCQHPYCRLIIFLLYLLPSFAYAGVGNAELAQQYENKVLTARQFYPGSKLHFDSAGNLSTPQKSGAWTVYGQLRVQKISLTGGVVRIEAQRLYLFYDPASKQLRDFVTIRNDEAPARHLNKKLLEKAAKEAKTEIEVECGTAQPEMTDVMKAMNAVFAAPDEPLIDIVPIYWKRWLEGKDAARDLSSDEVANVPHPDGSPYRVGGRVSPPHVYYDPDPQYSEVARNLKYQGTVILWVVISKEGRPTHIRVQRALGLGLDDDAVAAVEQWEFTPAKKDGEPVPVMINVEVNFRLY